jgi:hypothetical protein
VDGGIPPGWNGGVGVTEGGAAGGVDGGADGDEGEIGVIGTMVIGVGLLDC